MRCGSDRSKISDAVVFVVAGRTAGELGDVLVGIRGFYKDRIPNPGFLVAMVSRDPLPHDDRVGSGIHLALLFRGCRKGKTNVSAGGLQRKGGGERGEYEGEGRETAR
jgi:hypothetical protein